MGDFFKEKIGDLKENFHSVKPFIFMGIIALFLVFFYTSTARLGTDMPINQTAFNEPIPAFTDSTVTLTSWEYNPNEAFMEVSFEITNGEYVPFGSTYEFSAIEYQDQATQLPVKLVYQEDNKFTVQIENIPEDYQVVRLTITEIPYQYETTDEEISPEDAENLEEQQDYLTYNLYGDYREVEINKGLEKEKTEVEYVVSDIENEIEMLQIEIENLKATIEFNKQTIAEIEKEISELTEDMTYQTASEMEQTQTEIDNLNKEIETINQEILEMEAMILEKEEKISILQEEMKATQSTE